ncbi:hypothetical protein [Actinomycetospora soli]|uniref:hypothetical protein n=1 Tax=Actinomycetospora soli TaxID=2893887 RepID=UPI001E358243|nr:hypothetical protein [Actinomycetospora soli]MCD2186358.1 hypothetical protein [Actinomycetospora soli]
MGLSNRERRAAKQRKRDAKRGVTAPAARDDTGRGLPPETLQALLRRAGADVAAGREEAVAELRGVLAEHLARRRAEILAACDAVLADLAAQSGEGLAGALGGDAAASSWAAATGATTEETAIATVRVLAAVG